MSLEIRPGAGFQMGTLHAQVPRSLIGKWARRGLKGKRSGRSLPNLECLFKPRLSILKRQMRPAPLRHDRIRLRMRAGLGIRARYELMQLLGNRNFSTVQNCTCVGKSNTRRDEVTSTTWRENTVLGKKWRHS